MEDDLGERTDEAFSLRHRIGLVLGPLLFVVLWWRSDGTPQAQLLALYAWTGVWWLTEAIPTPATALLAICGAVVLGLSSSKDAFAALGNPVLFLFVGGFMIAEAMTLHGLGARFARGIATFAGRPLRAMVVVSSATFVMSMWSSNAAATAMVLPIALSLSVGKQHTKFRAALVLAVAWGASMGGLGTPVGTPPNLIGLRALDELQQPMTFLGFMSVGLPIGVLMLLTMWLVLALLFGVRPGQAALVVQAHEARPWSRGEYAALSSFLVAVVLWLIPGVLELFDSPLAKPIKTHLPEEVVALLAAGLLFVWPVQQHGEPRRTALSWHEAVRIDWGTVLLFGGGILLGDLANKTGLAKTWGEFLVSATGVHTSTAVIALVTAVAIVLSELASNTASATLVVPLAVALATATQTSVTAAVLGATIGASFGFVMPISTAPNAMAYATGAVSMRQMIRTGLVFDAIGYIVVVAFLSVYARL